MRKKRLKKTSLALLTAMALSAGSVTVYAAESFSLTMMPTLNTSKDSDPYAKSIEANSAYAQISNATYSSGNITLQVYNDDTKQAVTGVSTILVSDRTSHSLTYTGNYGSQSFDAFLRAEHKADKNCPAYAYVVIKWNPNG